MIFLLNFFFDICVIYGLNPIILPLSRKRINGSFIFIIIPRNYRLHAAFFHTPPQRNCTLIDDVLPGHSRLQNITKPYYDCSPLPSQETALCSFWKMVEIITTSYVCCSDVNALTVANSNSNLKKDNQKYPTIHFF